MACCTACATELPELAVFCSRCGQPNEPEFDRLLTRRIGGRYQIYRRLGEGGLSTVFVATDTRVDNIVVVKVSDPRLLVQFASGTQAEAREAQAYWAEMIERMRREVEALADLKHPNIVRVLATGAITDELRYVVMEFLRGRTLREEMNVRRRFDFVEAARIGAEVATGLHFVHARGIVHRDLTPRNIFLCEEGSEFGGRSSEFRATDLHVRTHNPEPPTPNSQRGAVKVIDFGIAKFPQPPGAPPYTQHAVMCGTPGYSSPEQCQNLSLDHRADIYSLGVVLYEMVTGQRPFTGRAATEIALKQMQGNPARPRDLAPDLPLRLEALILRALARDPQARHQSAEELAAELRAVATRIVVPLTEPVVPLAARGRGAPRGRTLLGEFPEPELTARPIGFETPVGEVKTDAARAETQAANEDELSECAGPPADRQADQLQIVCQRRRRVFFATAAMVALLVAGGLLFAGPWFGGRQAESEQLAAQASPSAAATSQPLGLTSEGQDAATSPTVTPSPTAAPSPNAASKRNDAPSGTPPRTSTVASPGQASSRNAVAQGKAPASMKSATQHAGAAHRARQSSSQPSRLPQANPPQVSPSQPAAVPSPTIADARLPHPTGTPDPRSAPRATPAPAVAREEVAANARRDRDEMRGPQRQTAPPQPEVETGPKLYSWRGEVSRERQVTIEMPGEPGTIQIPRDYRKRVGVVEPPGPSNGWRRVVLRVFGDGLVSVIVRWYPHRRAVDPRYQWARRGANTD